MIHYSEELKAPRANISVDVLGQRYKLIYFIFDGRFHLINYSRTITELLTVVHQRKQIEKLNKHNF